MDTVRFTAGIEGSLPENLGPLSSWVWDLSYTYGRTEGTNINKGNFYRPRVANALGPSFEDEDGKHFVERLAMSSHGCVPLNLFGGQTIPSPKNAGLHWLCRCRNVAYNELESVNFTIGGDVYEIPFGG